MEVGSNFITKSTEEYQCNSIYAKENIMAVISGFEQKKEGINYGVDLNKGS